MKILIANYRYFVSGGPERYLFNVQRALEARGHKVVPFSIRYRQNEDTPYSSYFVEPLGGDEAVYFDQHDRSLRTVRKSFERLFCSREVERALLRLIEDSQPDIAYVLHYLRKLSPSVLTGIKKQGIPIVVRLSDYMMVCPEAHLFRDENPCRACVGSAPWLSVRHRCVKGSLLLSTVNLAATLWHTNRRVFDLVDRFVVPSAFMKNIMVEAGWNQDRIEILPTFAQLEAPPSTPNEGEAFILYAGQLARHKGVHVLIDAYAEARKKDSSASPNLVIAGDMNNEYGEMCRGLIRARHLENHVHCVGKRSAEDLARLYQGALFTVIPSLWYENLPHVALESFVCGTPVLASEHGSLKEIINEATGAGFAPGEVSALSDLLCEKWRDKRWCLEVGRSAREYVQKYHAEDRHMEQLLGIFRRHLDE